MPITFKTPQGKTITGDAFGPLQEKVRKALAVHPDADVTVGMTSSTVRWHEVVVSLQVGIADLTKETEKLASAAKRLDYLFGAINVGHPVEAPSKGGAAPTVVPFEEMTDEMWVQSVQDALFPGTIPLCKATALHQPVNGTSGGSVYKTCFLGESLKVACRIKGSKVSFRITTAQDLAPEGDMLEACERLGVDNKYTDRLTCHCAMSGPYTASTAAEYRALFGAFYAALRPWTMTPFPSIAKLCEGVK